MGWSSALKKQPVVAAPALTLVTTSPIPRHQPDLSRLVTLDFETYYDTDYTLRKLSTSEYIRDPRFKAHMVGIKVGKKAPKVYPGADIQAALDGIDWTTHSLLAHHANFDGLILSHHYNVRPRFIYDTLSMARGLHSNDISARLDDVAGYYGVGNKIPDVLEQTKGVIDLPKPLYKACAAYCAEDVRLTFEIFLMMLDAFPHKEIELINLTCRLFTDPILKVNVPLVEKELVREIAHKERLLLSALGTEQEVEKLLQQDPLATLKNAERRELEKKGIPDPTSRDVLLYRAKKAIGSEEVFAGMLRNHGITPPMKISPAYFKHRDESKKYAYAFAKTDLAFSSLMEHPDPKIRDLVETRLSVKSTTNETRAERFIRAGEGGMSLPVYLNYYGAATGRWSGGNKLNLQNLKREDPDDPENTGILRKSILAPKGHVLVVVDSGQIEARVNAWLWGQDDLLATFRDGDKGIGRDAYCKFADKVYGREITKKDKLERFVGKVCLAADTRVLTNHGVKRIVEVGKTDLLWDGLSWVKHDGLLDQGIRETLTYRGLCATPDHDILTERGWRAWRAVLTDPSLFQSALSSASLPSSAGSITYQKRVSHGATDPYAAVAAAGRTWSMPAVLKQAARHVVTFAQRSQRVRSGSGDISMPWRTTYTAHACSTGFLPPSAGALTRAMLPMFTTGSVVYRWLRNGARIVRRFCTMSRLCPDGTTPSSKWTGSKPIAVMNPVTSGLFPGLLMPVTSGASKTSNSAFASLKQRTRTYDLANAGRNHRFTVLTDDGPVIVHNCVLGLGYQMGANKFQNTLALGTMGPPVFFEEAMCKTIVNTYRRENYRIKQGWDFCASTILPQMARGIEGEYKCLRWEKNTLWLPNGMALKYPNLKLENNGEWDEWSYEKKGERTKIYGGLLTENIVQALARIIVGEQMLAIDQMGYRVVMTTHDEVVSVVKKAKAARCYKDMLKRMQTPLDWCLDLPLNAEGGYAENYSK